MKKAALLLVFFAVSFAGAKTLHAPLPNDVMQAKTVYLDNEGDTANFDKAYSEFQKWGKYAIVSNPAAADITVVFSTESKLIDGTTYKNTMMKVYPKGSSQIAFEASSTWPKKCVEQFKKRLAAD